MTSDDQIGQYADASEQAASTPSGCKACQRTGLPIFPLRVAAVPKALVNSGWKPVVPEQDVALTGGEFKYALRTLRMGYLYVLLDKKVWQGYQVTAEGYLRQFDPMAMPEGDMVEPLSQSCLTKGHDIAASFINIDDKKYSQAWLAFSSDPWSTEVLKAYQSGIRPSERFTQVSLPSLKKTPSSIPEALALDASLSVLKANVAEFATNFFPYTERVAGEVSGSAHGFYPRLDSASALGMRVAQMSQQYGCQIAALALNDEVGVVQELNNARIQVADACQAYTSKPEILHKHFISQGICQYLDAMKKAIDKRSQPAYQFPENMPTVWGGKSIPAEQVAEETFAEQYARLQKSYDEPARAAFATDYGNWMQGWEEKNKAIGKELAAWYRADSWLKTIINDYAPDSCARGWDKQFQTVSACIQGGGMDAETDKVWLEWVKTASSPAYIGFAGMQSSLLDTILSGGNVYSNSKTGLLSDEFGNYLKSVAIKRSWASRMAALSGSVARLNQQLDEAAYRGFHRMMQAGMLTATGESVVVFEYNTTIGQLQKDIKAGSWYSAIMAKNDTPFGGIGKRGSTSATDWVVGIKDKALLSQRIRVQKSFLGTLEEIEKTLKEIGQTDLPLNNPALLNHFHDMHISDISLQNKAGVNVMVSRPQIEAFNERMRRYISGNGFGVVLAMGMLGLQIADWGAKAKGLQDAMGNDPDATADYAINRLLVFGAIAETTGFGHMLTIKKNWLVLGEDFVHPLVKFGGVLAGVASVVDGVRMWIHAEDAEKAGDEDAAFLYKKAALATLAGGLISGVGAYLGVFTLFSETWFLGPAGWGAALILAGMIWAYEANQERSTPFEIWLRSCCFGIPHDSDIVWQASSLADLNTALAAYNAITSGMVAEVAITGTAPIQSVDYNRVDIKLCLPGYHDFASSWELCLTGGTDNRVLFSKAYNLPDKVDQPAINRTSQYSDSYQQAVENDNLIIQITIWVKQNRNPVVALVASYWPDKLDAHNKLALTVTAE
ncbi:T6SS effector BTH_I2691 family protein [Atlantibacter sp.]|uniref:T6SS effector BTH_I2691 family protein n=1 Tax=Atlantibacter sp. TaxID=1903473 RepID=UPI0028A7BEA9|nr:T6SS effector BTH_I2691 family protein [Atlantibacter sp.]